MTQHIHLVLLYDLPAAAWIRVCGCAPEQHARGPTQERSVGQVRVARDPAAVSGAPGRLQSIVITQ